MSDKKSSSGDGYIHHNRISEKVSFEGLVPATSVEGLLSEAEARQAEYNKAEIEELGKSINKINVINSIYPVAYEYARSKIESGLAKNDLISEINLIADGKDDFASIVRIAFEDALENRPPQYG